MILKNGNPKTMGKNPASVNLETGEITINPFIWHRLEDWEKAIILLHEEGHYKNQTLSEIKADLHAIQKFAGTEQSSVLKLKETMFRFIPNSDSGQQRKIQFVKNLLYFDANANENKESQLILDDINSMEKTANFAPTDLVAATDIIGSVLPFIKMGIDLYNEKWGGAWSNAKDKDQILDEFSFLACYNIYAYYGGTANHNEAIQAIDYAAQKGYTDPSSLFSLIYQGMLASGLFDGDGRENVKSNRTFWESNGMTNAQWTINKANAHKASVVRQYIADKTIIANKQIVKYVIFGVIVIALIAFIKKYNKK